MIGSPLAVRWLRFHTSNAGGTGPIPGWGTKIPHASHLEVMGEFQVVIFWIIPDFCVENEL